MTNYSISEISKNIKVPKNVIYNWIKKNKLKSFRKGIKFYVLKEDLEEFLKKKSEEVSFYKTGIPEGYLTADGIAKRLKFNRQTILSWINQGRFKNVKKPGTVSGIYDYLVSENSVIEYETQLNNIKENYLIAAQASKVLNISSTTLNRWIKEGIITTEVRLDGHIYIPTQDILSLRDEIEKEISVPEASKILNISTKRFMRLCNPNYLRISTYFKRHVISKDDLNKMEQENTSKFDEFTEYYDTKMLAEYFKESQMEIVRWVAQERFENVIKGGGAKTSHSRSLLVPKESVIKYEEYVKNLKDHYIKASEAHEVIKVSQSTVNNWLKNGKISNAIYWLKCWYIPIVEIEKLKKEMLDSDKLIGLSQACSLLNVTRNALEKFIKNGVFKTIMKDKKVFLIKEEVDNIPPNFIEKKQRSNPSKWGYQKKPSNFFTVKEVASTLDITIKKATRLFENGNVKVLKFHENNAIVNAINQGEINKLEIILQIQKENLNCKEAAKYLGDISHGKVSILAKQGYFPNVKLLNKTYYIPKQDLNEYQKLKETNQLPKYNVKEKIEKEKKSPQSKIELLEKLLNSIEHTDSPSYLLKTKEYYIEYMTNRISSLNGNLKTIKSECSRIQKTFTNLILTLPKEIYLLDDQDVQMILSNTFIPISQRELLNWFIQYVFNIVGLVDRKKFNISASNQNNKSDKEIYSPEIYLMYLTYSKDINLHISEALKSQYYANMWLYTIMHLIDSWRGSDIVNILPSIHLEVLNIHDFDWFLTNQLSKEQAQIVVNQVYIKTKIEKTSKTGALISFLVPDDFVIPVAIALVLCELHRSKNNHDKILATLINSNQSAKVPSRRHLKFFQFNEVLMDFKSLIMNRSTMTYLFHSIAEDSPDPELALTYTKYTRSHEREASTAVYVKATNRDGSIGKVSIDLFNRGHFGWIYNTLIKMMLNEMEGYHSLEERTKLIQNLRNEYTPIEMELWATFINNIDTKRQPIIRRLNQLSQKDIRDLISEIFKGEKPARNQNGQCFTHPICEKPNLGSCFHCEFFIPQVYVLIHMKYELERLLLSLENGKNENIIQRDSQFLSIHLLILNEAIAEFGKEYVETFVDLKNIKERVLQVSKYLLMNAR